jgi:hypothetical protein
LKKAASPRCSYISRVQPGTNIVTGGTGNAPTISTVANPFFGNITASGASGFFQLSATTLAITGTIYSGAGFTNLYNIFSTTDTVTRVQPGTNITTGGSANAPTINVTSSPSFTNVSASTIYSGSTNIGTLFGDVRSGSSIGSTVPVFAGKSGTALQFKNLSGSNGVIITDGGRDIAFRGTNIYYDSTGQSLNIDPIYTDYIFDSPSASATYNLPGLQKDLSVVITLTQNGSTLNINNFSSDVFFVDTQTTNPAFTTFSTSVACSYRFLCTGSIWFAIKLL